MNGLIGRSARVRTVAFSVVGGGFARGGDIFRPGILQDLLAPFDPVRVVAMDGHENSALFHATLIALGFVFRNAHTHRGSDEAADRAARTNAGQSGQNRTSGDKWPKARNR